MPGQLYAVIATLDSRETLAPLLRTLSEDGRFRVVLIDNGSQPDFRQWLYQLASDGMVVLCNEHNAGVATAWNQGIRFAAANAAAAVLICGADTCPMPGTLDRLYALADGGCPFITGTQVAYDTPVAPVPALTPSDPLILAPDFSFFLVPMVTFETLARHETSVGVAMSPWCVGLFDERFSPAYFEDNDFHVRLHRAGLVAARDPQALFRHDCSYTIRTHPDLARTNQQTFARNAEFFRRKYGALPHELDVPAHARPLNVTDEQWAQMTGGRPLQEIDRSSVVAQARRVYAAYGILPSQAAA